VWWGVVKLKPYLDTKLDSGVQNMLARLLQTVALVLAVAGSGCTSDIDLVRADIDAIAREEFGSKAEVTLIDAVTGEGDFDHRYINTRIRVRAREAFRIEAGLFKDLSMEPGDPPREITIELVYQWRWSDSRWHLIHKHYSG
jgi:hypothetical protein